MSLWILTSKSQEIESHSVWLRHMPGQINQGQPGEGYVPERAHVSEEERMGITDHGRPSWKGLQKCLWRVPHTLTPERSKRIGMLELYCLPPQTAIALCRFYPFFNTQPQPTSWVSPYLHIQFLIDLSS